MCNCHTGSAKNCPIHTQADFEAADRAREVRPLEEFKWYLGGPMSGYPSFNFPAFDQACRVLREKLELTVISAHEVDHGEHTGTGTAPYEDYLRGDLMEMLKCDGLILLQGWPESKGARFEFDIAVDLRYPVMFYYSEHTFDSHLIPMSRREQFYAC
jgi:hypothetical protein